MSSRCHRQARHLLPLLIFTLLASTSTAYSSQQMASGRFDRRQQTVRSPSRVLGKSSNEFSRNRTIHAALTGSLNGGGEPRSVLSTVKSIAKKNFLIVGMAGAVLLARGYPELGKNGGVLRPELFIGSFGVTTIFLMSGLLLDISELKQAFSNIKLNALIQLTSFLVWPFFVGLPFKWAMIRFLPGFLPVPLLDGLLILTCLPTTVNMCVFLTTAAGGNVASALCNAVIGNMAGILLTPALLLRFFGTQVQLPFLAMVMKLVNKVVVPVAIGQALRLTKAKAFFMAHSKECKKIQEGVLIAIIWNAFCEAFSSGWGLQFGNAIKLLVTIIIMHLTALRIGFEFFERCGFPRGEVVAGMFCASHKTLAFGLPLLNTIFEGDPNLAAYCAPLMFIHPLQLVLGSLFLGRLEKYTSGETKVAER